MPFMVDTGAITDAVRNGFFLACVNADYFWRAKLTKSTFWPTSPIAAPLLFG